MTRELKHLKLEDAKVCLPMTLDKILELGRNRYSIFKCFFHKPIIYKITNIVDDKVYIGQTTTLSKRLTTHFYLGRTEKIRASRSHLHCAFKKLGFGVFNFDVIEICDNLERLDDREKYWIDFYGSANNVIGYNLTHGGRAHTVRNAALRQKDKITNKIAYNKKVVYLYDALGAYKAEFDSLASCGKFLNRDDTTVNRAVKLKSLINGHLVSHYMAENIGPPSPPKDTNTMAHLYELVENETGVKHTVHGKVRLSKITGYSVSAIEHALHYNGSIKYKPSSFTVRDLGLAFVE